MVSGIDICFSTDSFEWRSNRRRRISSVVFGVGAIYIYVNTDGVLVRNVLTFLADVLADMMAMTELVVGIGFNTGYG
jgi:hypothetical protein